jgi:hypothetical protein
VLHRLFHRISPLKSFFCGFPKNSVVGKTALNLLRVKPEGSRVVPNFNGKPGIVAAAVLGRLDNPPGFLQGRLVLLPMLKENDALRVWRGPASAAPAARESKKGHRDIRRFKDIAAFLLQCPLFTRR